jgi:hypothetical protein
VGLQHGEAKGNVRDSSIRDGRRTGASSPKRRQWRLQNLRSRRVSGGRIRRDVEGGSVEVMHGLVGEEMVRGGKGATTARAVG